MVNIIEMSGNYGVWLAKKLSENFGKDLKNTHKSNIEVVNFLTSRIRTTNV